MTQTTPARPQAPEDPDSPALPSIPSYFSRENLYVALAGLLVYASLAAYLQYRQIFFYDAVSRTASAFNVLYSRDPHLAAIGFVWNPLPTLLQIPVVFVFNLLNIDPSLAGRLQSVVAASGTLALLCAFFRGFAIGPIPRRVLVALFGMNPMIMLYAANGMSESLFIFLVTLIVVSFVWWARTGVVARFTHMTFASMFALQTRYEALPVIAGVAFCLMPVMAPLARRLGVRPTVRRVEAHLITFIFATAYSFGIWVYFNWQIMGNPLFFLQSVYGNAAQVGAGDRALFAAEPAIGSVPLSLAYSFGQTLWLAPALAVIAPAALVQMALRRNVSLFCVFLLAITIPVFQAYEIYTGDSFKWLRFFVYGVPFTYTLFGFVASAVAPLLSGWQARTAWGLAMLFLAISNAFTFYSMLQPDTASEEWVVMNALMSPDVPVPPEYSRATESEIANYLKALRDDDGVILDAFLGNWITLLSSGPTRPVVTSDRDFESILASPSGRVAYILVPDPSTGGVPDRLNVEFLGLWQEPIPAWLELEREFPSQPDIWKVSRVRESVLTVRYVYERVTSGEVLMGPFQMLPLSAINDPIAEQIPMRRYEPRRWRLFHIVEPRPGA